MKPATYDEVMEMDSLACRVWNMRADGWFAPRTNPDAPLCSEWSRTCKGKMEHGGWDYRTRQPLEPIPDTLDAAAACLPDRTKFIRVCRRGGSYEWATQRYWGINSNHIPDTGDEKLDRFRLAVLARSAEMAIKGGA